MLLGNAAIVRGALEAGVAYATGYPGTPSSEVTDGFARIAAARGIAFEYAVNEKVALELAFAASLAGSRSICAMKHLGLMVAGDPLSTIPYMGVVAGMVIVSASDPGCRTSPNEHDQRYLGPMLKLPILEPATVADAHRLTRFAFTLSEQTELPVLLRVTTRVAHSRARVRVGPLCEPHRGKFVRAPERRVPVPHNARRMRVELSDRIERARSLLGNADLLTSRGQGSATVIAIGAPAATTADVIEARGLGQRVRLWTLRAAYPLPEQALAELLATNQRVLVVEELAPYLEDCLLALAQRRGLRVSVLGKHSGHLPEPFEYTPEIIERALSDAFELRLDQRRPVISLPVVPTRSPSLCPACPHRAAFFAARAAFGPDTLFFNDIGCYTLGFGSPLNAADALLCMGAGFSLATGVSRASGTRSVGFMGDSTFFHAGVPALLQAIKESSNVVLVVLDNGVTAMTGFQESPTTPGVSRASIPDVARALGAQRVETVDPWNVAATIAAFERAARERGPSVIVVARSCPVYEARATHESVQPPVVVDAARCQSCGREEAGMRCSLPLSEGYQRNLAHARATRQQTSPTPAVAPCAVRCPLFLCVQGYAGHIAAGEHIAAARHVVERTPLAETVCRVCDRPCEDACVRSEIDEAVAINDLKRFAVEWARENAPELLQLEPAVENGRRVAIVGAGPSGLAAAQELRLRGFSVTLFDARARAGGLLSHAIPEHRLPTDALERDVARIVAAGVELRTNARLGRDVTLDELLASHDAVLLALGAGGARKLELGSEPGAPPLLPALDYLEHVRAGAGDRLGRVAVIGGGNAAIDAARTALRMNATSVVIACLEPRDQMPALRDEILAAEAEGIRILAGVRPVRATRSGILVEPVAPGAPAQELGADQVLVAIGQRGDRSFLDGSTTRLELDADGCVLVDALTGQSSHPRVFAGGDGSGAERSVTSALASGLRAAWGIARALTGEAVADRRMPPPAPRKNGTAHFEVTAPRLPRRRPPELAPAHRIRELSEVIGTFDEATARAEARRCLACGLCGNCRACIDTLACPALIVEGERISVDAGLCMGCNVCLATCSNGALLPGVTG
jgi:indolepyruvate ferredoxin oxidoreductase, alpha subunit